MYETLNRASKFNYYNCGNLSYNATQYSLINMIYEKGLIHHNNNKRFYQRYSKEKDIGIYLFQKYL